MLYYIKISVDMQTRAGARAHLPTAWRRHWMGDRLWAGKPSRYVTSHLGQLRLSSRQQR